MKAFDAFDHDLRTWLEGEAAGEIPVGVRHRALQAAIGHQPRLAALARIGSHWVGDSPTNPWPRREVPVVDARSALVVALLAALALLATGLVVAGLKQWPVPDEGGRLVYELDGDLVLAGGDGSRATVIRDGAPETESAVQDFALIPEVWAPDGEHFVYHESGPEGLINHIADADGKTVATFQIGPTSDDLADLGSWWSPDSTMLATLLESATEVTTFGLDGKVVAVTPLPRGYRVLGNFRLSGWTPDGTSVLAIITTGRTSVLFEVWQLPLDGSKGRQVRDGDPFVSPAWDLSPDGQVVAFSGHVNLDGSTRYAAPPLDGADTIYIAELSSGIQRPVAGTTHLRGVRDPLWSPDGTQILYTVGSINQRNNVRYEIHVVEVASGVDRLVATVPAFERHAWSPTGDSILIAGSSIEPGIGGLEPLPGGVGSQQDRGQRSSLWSVTTDGTTVELVAEGVFDFAATP